MSDLLMAQWQTLTDQPLSFVREQAVSECFERPVSAEQMAALRGSRRFDQRIEQRLAEHFHLQPLNRVPAPDVADLTVILLTEADLLRLPKLCGAVWHAATLSREIRSEVVNQYREALGVDTLNLALRMRQLAGAADLLRTPAALLDAIERDGAACIGAWLAAQPQSLREWLQLRLDPALQSGVHDPRQVMVVRSVASDIAAAGQVSLEKGSQHDD
jgi:hypothetical protein